MFHYLFHSLLYSLVLSLLMVNSEASGYELRSAREISIRFLKPVKRVWLQHVGCISNTWDTVGRALISMWSSSPSSSLCGIFSSFFFVLKLPLLAGFRSGDGTCCVVFAVACYICAFQADTSDPGSHTWYCLRQSPRCKFLHFIESRTTVMRFNRLLCVSPPPQTQI